jgi:hypothetical protein
MVGFVLGLMLVLTVLMWFLQLIFGDGWTGVGINFWPKFMGQYILCFCLGLQLRYVSGLARLPGVWFGYWCMILGLLWYGVGFAISSVFNVWQYTDAGWKLFWTAVWQGFAALWGTGLLIWARHKWTLEPGAVGRRIIGAAYGVYILHPLVVVAYARGLNMMAMHPLAWIAVMIALVVPTTWALSMALKTIPGVDRVL